MTEKTAKFEMSQHRNVPAFRSGREKAAGTGFPAHDQLLSHARGDKSPAFSSIRVAPLVKR